MNQRISIADKKPEAKSQNLAPQIRRKTESHQSMNSPVDHILFLQRTIGNQAVGKLIKSGALQAKLRIGQAGDIYEQEADRGAEQVMRMPDVSEAKDTRIQRKCPKCLRGLLGKDKKDEKLQAKEIRTETPEVTSNMETNINTLRGKGQPLPESVRAFFEPRFGTDFSRVRVHSGAAAEQSAEYVNANAYTVGPNIVFGAGRFAPGMQEGRRLIAHELTHVVQQGAASASEPTQLQLNLPGDRFEQKVDRVADAVMTIPKKDLPRIVDTDSSAYLSLKLPILQRTAKFVKGTVSEDVNPAEQIAENKVADGDLFLGNTDFVLNKTIFFAGKTAPRNALHTPGIGSAKRTDRGVDCWFSSVPDNVGSYQMKLLKKNSWTHVTDKKNVAGRFPTLKACKNGFGQVTFVVRANSNLRTKVETHEKHHAKDYEAIFSSVLVPWDDKVTDAHKNSKKMAGTNDDVCEKNLYLASVGKKQTPDDIISSIVNDINTRAVAFHNSSAGGKPNVSIVDRDSDCTVVKVKVE